MSRRKIVAGNWKMNTLYKEAIVLAEAVNQYLESHSHQCEVVICPPFPYLSAMNEKFSRRHFALGAQNCANAEKGAFTGETSATMLQSVGVEKVIIGHSERRSIYHETDQQINAKIKIALANGLKVIFCIGETLTERESGKLEEVISRQITNGLQDIDAETLKNIVIAYEPVWAIGTGVTASPEQAQEAHAFVRGLITKQYDKETAEQIIILYGGSCNAKNAATLFSQPDIDGGLIGGASLIADDFIQIIKATA